MTVTDQEIRRALSRAAAAVPVDVDDRLKEVNRRGPMRAKARRMATVIVAAMVTAAALLVLAFLLPLRRELRPGAGALPGRIGYTQVTVNGDRIDWDAYVAAGDGSAARRVLDGRDSTFAPAFSPDGQSIAFVFAEDDAASRELWISRADGSDARPVVEDLQVSGDSTPAWSPDGQRIAFIASGRGGNAVWMVDPDGSAARQILEGGWSQVSWSPEGSRLALTGFPGESGRPGLYVVGAEGSDLVRLLTFGGRGAFPVWSTAGDRIAFMALDPRDDVSDYAYDVFVVNADGSGLIRLTRWEGFDGFPVWSPDGSQILFSSDRTATQEQLERNRAGEGWFGASLHLMGSDGSDPRLLLPAGEASLLPTSWVP